jgi:hypothetical protein
MDFKKVFFSLFRQANSPDMGSLSSYSQMQVSQPDLENVKPQQAGRENYRIISEQKQRIKFLNFLVF